jgi:hypothetical protein
MFNQSGITKTSGLATRQILATTDMQFGTSIVVGQTNAATVDAKKIQKAGTPVYGNLAARATAFVPETTTGLSPVLGVYKLKIATAATAGDTITIDGVTYTAGAEEDVETKVFAVGADAAAQVTSLLKMITCANFTVTGATDTLTFTQKIAEAGNMPYVTVVKAPSTGAMVVALTTYTAAVTGSKASNAVGVLLHDVDVTAGNANGTLLQFGFVQLNRLESDVQALITAEVKAALNGKVTFIV